MLPLSRLGFRVALAVVLVTALSPAIAHAQSGSWTTAAPMLSPPDTNGPTGDVIDGRLYVVGMTAAPFLSFGRVYDPASDSWSAIAPPMARSYGMAAAMDGLLYYAGGCAFNSDCRVNVTGALQAYDPATNAWTTLAPMPTPRLSAVMAAIDGKLYVVGGVGTCPPCEQISETDIYDPVTNSWTTGAAPPTLREGAAGVVIDGKLYVAGGFYR